MDAEMRQCGDCKLCCKVFTITEMNKVAGEWCPHCPGKGCSIYQSRPDMCKEYRCMWLERPETFPDELRPDRTSVVMNEFAEPGLPIIELHESQRGAAKVLLPVVEPVRDHGIGLVVVYGGHPHTMFPPHFTGSCRRRNWERRMTARLCERVTISQSAVTEILARREKDRLPMPPNELCIKG